MEFTLSSFSGATCKFNGEIEKHGTIISLFLITEASCGLCVVSIAIFYNYGLVVKALDSQSKSLVFKTTGWLQGRLSLSSFRGR